MVVDAGPREDASGQLVERLTRGRGVWRGVGVWRSGTWAASLWFVWWTRPTGSGWREACVVAGVCRRVALWRRAASEILLATAGALFALFSSSKLAGAVGAMRC